MDPRVAEARPRDALAIRALHRAVLEEGSWFVRTPDELPELDAVEASIARYRKSENSAWFLVKRKSQVLGMLTLTGGRLARTRHVVRLEMMVARSARGEGHGTALLDHALAWAESAPLVRKVALAVYADNERAIGLYRSRGFVDEGRRVAEYMDGDVPRDDLLLARFF